uniref:Uncharacterized protein n=1 Tax=Solanum lycopersicum TaxID=4081 RepID=A0A3Q7GPD4_SOLLC
MACYHRPWSAHTDERPRAWHVGMTLGLLIQLDDIGVACSHGPCATHSVGKRRALLGKQTQSDYVGLSMPSSPLGIAQGQTTSGVSCHYFPGTTYMVRRRQV